MSGKKCALCKKSAYGFDRGSGSTYWLCSDCRIRVDSYLETAFTSEQGILTGKSICDKCRKRLKQCRFKESERNRITDCSDWEAKDTERNRRRWAKFET